MPDEIMTVDRRYLPMSCYRGGKVAHKGQLQLDQFLNAVDSPTQTNLAYRQHPAQNILVFPFSFVPSRDECFVRTCPKLGVRTKAEPRSDRRKKHVLVTQLHHPQKDNALIRQADYSFHYSDDRGKYLRKVVPCINPGKRSIKLSESSV